MGSGAHEAPPKEASSQAASSQDASSSMGSLAGNAPIRTCVGCRSRRPQAELIRVAAKISGGRPAALFDNSRRMAGRGAWLCADNPDCLAKALQKGRLARALKVTDPDLSSLTC